MNWKRSSPHNVGITYSRVTGDRVRHCPCSGGSHTGFQDQPPRSSRTFHFTPVSCQFADASSLGVSYATQVRTVLSVARVCTELHHLWVHNQWVARVAEQGPSVVPTRHVPLALVTASSLGVEAGNDPLSGSWILSSQQIHVLVHQLWSVAPLPSVHPHPSSFQLQTAAVIFTLSGSQESCSSSVLFKLLIMTKTLSP